MTPLMPFIHDDGGRAAAGYKGSAGDCVARSIAIAAERPYAEVYAALAAGMGAQRASTRTPKHAATARNGIFTRRKWFRDYMRSLGFEFVPTMAIGSGCKVHLVAAELPAGRLIVSVSKHYTAVVDGVIRDTFDPNQRPPVFYAADARDIPAGAKPHGGGWLFEPGPRCVYGYWRKVAP